MSSMPHKQAFHVEDVWNFVTERQNKHANINGC